VYELSECCNQRDQRRRDQQRWQQVADGYGLDVQQPQADPKQQQAAGRSDCREVGLGQHVADEYSEDGEGSLHDDDGHDRCHHAGAE
jgi:hypothetical protein